MERGSEENGVRSWLGPQKPKSDSQVQNETPVVDDVVLDVVVSEQQPASHQIHFEDILHLRDDLWISIEYRVLLGVELFMLFTREKVQMSRSLPSALRCKAEKLSKTRGASILTWDISQLRRKVERISMILGLTNVSRFVCLKRRMESLCLFYLKGVKT